MKYIFLAIIALIILSFVVVTLTKKDRLFNIIRPILLKISENKILLLFSILCILFSISYLLLPGFIEGHDFVDRITLIQGIADEIKNGNFPAFIMTDYVNGYGFGLEIIYTVFFYYFPALLNVIGIPLGISYKIYLLFIVLSCFTSMYYCIKTITGSKTAASVFSSLYVTSSYFFTDLYLRADLGENLNMIFLPFVILGLYEIIFGKCEKGFYFTVGLIGCYVSHVLSCYLDIYFVVLILLFNIKRLFSDKNRIKYLLIYGLLAIAIVSFFWMPMFDSILSDNLRLTAYVDKASGLNNFSFVNPLFAILEIFNDGYLSYWLPPGLGVIFIFLFIDFFIGKVWKRKENAFFVQIIIIGVIFLFMSTRMFPWELFYSILGIMEFPWRFYMFITVCFVFGFSCLLSTKNEESINFKKALSILICICFTFFVYTYNLFIRQPTFIRDYNLRFTSVWNGTSIPCEVKLNDTKSRGNVITTNNDELIFLFEKNTSNINIDYSNNKEENTYLDLPLIYYKGYKVKNNSSNVSISKSPEGLVRVNLFDDAGSIKVYYGFTNSRIIGLIISLLAIVYYIYFVKKNVYYNKSIKQ